MANPANFARHNQAFNSDSLQRGICFANFTPRCKPLRRQAGSVLPVNLALVPSYSALCRPPLTPALRLSLAVLAVGFGAPAGFACIRCAGFQPFWPLALVQSALVAIVLAALRRFGGAAVFRGSRPSSGLGASFWPSGLTVQSSGLAFGQPLTFGVRVQGHVVH